MSRKRSPAPKQPPSPGPALILWTGIGLLLLTLVLGTFAIVVQLNFIVSVISLVLAVLAIPIGILQFKPELISQAWQTRKMGLGVIGIVIGMSLLVISLTLNIYLLTHPSPSPVSDSAHPSSMPTPIITATITTSPSLVATNSPTITTATPLMTLQALCNTDYQTQWDLFTSDAQKGYWGNDESIYVSGLRDRDTSHGGVVNCAVTKVAQNGSTASGTVTTTFGDRAIDTKTFHLTKGRDGVWRIYLIAG